MCRSFNIRQIGQERRQLIDLTVLAEERIGEGQHPDVPCERARVPFLVSSVVLGAFLTLFRRYRPFIPIVERAAGVLLIVVGALVATNCYVVLNSWAISLTPDWILKRL